MKLRLLAIAFFVTPHLALGAEIGAFFTQVNAYIYTAGPREGKRFLVRPRQAFSVLNLQTDADDRLWLNIVHPRRRAKASGAGWTPLTPAELLNSRGKEVEIFAEASDGGGTATVIAKVPASDVELLNVTKPSTRFPQVIWHKVRYATNAPLHAWVQGVTGIFRPGKSAEFMRRVYVEMVSRNLKKDKLKRLLSGVVRVGDSPWDVERALGAPLRTQKDQAAGGGKVTWQYHSLTVRFENEVVNQIN